MKRRPILDLVQDTASGTVFYGICDPGLAAGRIVSRREANELCGADNVAHIVDLARRLPDVGVLPAVVSTDRTRFTILPAPLEEPTA